MNGELRETIATLIEPHLRIYEGNRAEAERVADRILTIPKIAEALAAQGIEARQRQDPKGLDPKDESPVA